MADEEQDESLVTVVVGEQVEPEPVAAPEPDWPVDELCAAAVDLARAALLEEADSEQIGEHEAAVADGPLVVTHYFAGTVPGYVGWHWAVTVTRDPDSDHVTIDETSLLPTGSALLAPAWVPWKKRIRSGDLGAGDVLVTEEQDARLVPGMAEDDIPEPEDDLRPQQWELGLGRRRILSPEGRREAAHRWYREAGPNSKIARGTELECRTCGFLLLIGGPLGQAFGVCANGFSPVDGRVVAMNFGCGAHSETPEVVAEEAAEAVVNELGYDDLAVVAEAEGPEAESADEVEQPEQPEEPEKPEEPEEQPEQPADAAQEQEASGEKASREGGGDDEHESEATDE